MNLSFCDFLIISKLRDKYTDSPEGNLIDDVLEDSRFPVDVTTKKEISTYMTQSNACSQALEAFNNLWKDYRSSNYTSKDLSNALAKIQSKEKALLEDSP